MIWIGWICQYKMVLYHEVKTFRRYISLVNKRFLLLFKGNQYKMAFVVHPLQLVWTVLTVYPPADVCSRLRFVGKFDRPDSLISAGQAHQFEKRRSLKAPPKLQSYENNCSLPAALQVKSRAAAATFKTEFLHAANTYARERSLWRQIPVLLT